MTDTIQARVRSQAIRAQVVQGALVVRPRIGPIVSRGVQGLPGSSMQTTLTTLGDLLVHNGTAAVRLPVGTNGQWLTANSADPEGVEWQGGPVDTGWSALNVTPTRVFDADNTSVDELADLFGTLQAALIARGVISA